ncbi:CPBP family intramembrane glutamic endopeptidase [Kineococcus sp. SYSU DK002]|uniref:CPBP family intramembrane glutamic endopeptidase n=1 Tax=Kineococcus sp. SYSU DK002 TaxID=3383123 RepID=UPI003D7E17C4
MRVVKQLGFVMIVALLGSLVVRAVQWNAPLTLVLGFAAAAATVLAYRWIVRRTERRAPTELLVRGAGRALGRGALIGFALFGSVIALMAVFGDYQVDGWGSASGAVALLGFSAAAAVTEEVIFRGVLFRVVEGRLGSWLALVLTAALFGASHLLNPHSSLWGAVAITVEAGAMLAAAYVATRTLWLPIGLHFAWNFAEGGVFGMSVSGTDQPQGLLLSSLSGPTWITGGDFGPEASVFSVLVCSIVTVGFLLLAHRRGNLRRRGVDRAGGTAAPHEEPRPVR